MKKSISESQKGAPSVPLRGGFSAVRGEDGSDHTKSIPAVNIIGTAIQHFKTRCNRKKRGTMAGYYSLGPLSYRKREKLIFIV